MVILPSYPEDRPKYKLMNADTYEMNLKYCTIRPDKFILSKARVETPWTVEMGIFKDYLKENKPALIDKCFKSDWDLMKTLKYKKSDVEEVKVEMQRVYPLIKEAYRN